jgi:branched-chain amino acid transport system permease protein
VLTVALTGASLALLGWFVTRTDVGLGMRAAAEDLGAAHLVGLNVNGLIVSAFAIASAFAGLAGVLWAAQSGIVQYNMGFTPLLKAFVAAIIGGFGSIAGALIGGYLLGALEVAIVAFLPDAVSPYRDALVFALLIAFLLFRPRGLLLRTAEAKL